MELSRRWWGGVTKERTVMLGLIRRFLWAGGRGMGCFGSLLPKTKSKEQNCPTFLKPCLTYSPSGTRLKHAHRRISDRRLPSGPEQRPRGPLARVNDGSGGDPPFGIHHSSEKDSYGSIVFFSFKLPSIENVLLFPTLGLHRY